MTNIIDASAAFEDAAKPSHKDVADMIAEYALLKTANRITLDGEVIDRIKANRKEEQLNRAIKSALMQLGETELFVEGVGAVRLRGTDSIGYRLDAMSGQQIMSLLPVMNIKRTEVQEQIEGSNLKQYKPEWAWLREFEVRGNGATQLLFEEARGSGGTG